MRTLPLYSLFLIPLLVSVSCKKELNLNAGWKDVTIVYGVLSQLDSAHFIKITKAFLGAGNAMQYAQIPDSSNYASQLEVSLEAWNGNTLVATYPFDTTTIHDKEPGLFYFPDQRVYVNNMALNPDYLYKLVITNQATQKKITSQTKLVKPFAIDKPIPYQSLTFDSGKNNEIKWTSAAGGKRYQVMVRFHYLETLISDPTQSVEKYVDWLIIPSKLSKNDEGGEVIKASYANDGFYSLLHAKLKADPDIQRAARYLRYTFTVAANDLNTYIEVTQPTNSIIQEKPYYTNIENGIGLFSARYVQILDSLQLSPRTLDELTTNPLTIDLGF